MAKNVFLALLVLAFPLVPAAGPAGAQSSVTAGGEESVGYIIGGGDVIEVNVWRNEDLSRTVTVRPDGMISLPLIDDIAAAGLSVTALEKRVAQALLDANLISQPVVSVGILEAVSYRVYALGAMTTNGMITLSEPVTALQLLARAGGPTADADLNGAYILRKGGAISLNLGSTFRDRARVTNPGLVPGDILVIPEKETLREPVYRILVAGEVVQPLAIPYEEGLTIIDAFVQAGGGTEYSDLDDVRVVRREKGREDRVIKVDLTKLMKKGDLRENIELIPGDIVIVP